MYINIEQYYKTIIRSELSYDTGRLVLAYGPTCLGPRAKLSGIRLFICKSSPMIHCQ